MTRSSLTSYTTWRIRLIFALVTLGAVILGTRLYFVQIVHGEDYQEQAQEQYVRPADSVYSRGRILFRQKDGELLPAATIQSGFLAAIDPRQIEDPEGYYRLLAQFLDLEREKFLAQARQEDDHYEKIATEVSREAAKEVRALELPGVSFYPQTWRHYPGGSIASHTLGFVGHEDGRRIGQYGLERSYEDILRRSGNELYVNFFAELFSNVTDGALDNSKRSGDIVTTLEPTVQIQLEQALARIDEDWDSRFSGGVIMDPQTGRIYALAATPGYDPNTYEQVDSATVYRNPLVENVYEFGSIIKALTVAIGLDTGSITPDSEYYDPGTITLDGYDISNYDGRARGRVDMQTVLNQSLNTGAAYIAEQVGREQFAEQLLDLGLDEKTGIDLPNEANSLTGNLKSARPVEIANASFGQGIAMSPLAATRALAALANGGRLVTPYIGDEARFELGGSESLQPDGQADRVLDPESSRRVTRMLVQVVDEALAGGELARKRHSIAAKTGTAQIPKSGSRGYYEDRYLHSFFGYAPAYDPRFIIFLYTVEPQEVRYASQTLTDPFMKLTNFMINYYHIPPDR